MRAYRNLLWLSALLAFCVIGLGAYVRLSHAGLGCPDWPGCYGKLIGVPEAHHEQTQALAAFPGKPVEAAKAWKEMVHRYFAGTLGLCALAICILGWRLRRPGLPSVLVGVVALQAALGMWTVTRLLKPVIVSAHLIGGMTTLSLLVWLLLDSRNVRSRPPAGLGLRLWAGLALCAVALQLALGGWVSSNYAALICSDLPTCQGHWWPDVDFAQGFTFLRPLGEDGRGGLLGLPALTAIHWSHRLGALAVTGILGGLAWRLLHLPAWNGWGRLLAGLLLLQLSLGVANILLSLPLPVAVAHNLGAAALLTATVALNFKLARHRPFAPG